jgi:hypothetical protein
LTLPDGRGGGAPCASGLVAMTKNAPQLQAHLETAEISLALQFL